MRETPESKYWRVMRMNDRSRQRKLRIVFWIGLVVAFFAWVTIEGENFPTRVDRESQMRQSGYIQLETGKYSGDTDFGYFDGTGKFSFASGNEYEGQWAENIISGEGTFKFPGEGEYDGEFQNGLKDGNGEFIWEDGSKYTGTWHADQMDGQGEYISASGVIYKGTFRQNKFFEGTCTFANESGKYQLEYAEGSCSKAEIEFSDGTSYSGGCNGEALDGQGTMKFAQGDLYSGSFADGKRNGSGKYQWSSGDVFDGNWENDVMSGTGIYTFASGNIFSGTFQNNAIADGTYIVKKETGEYTFTISAGNPTRVSIALADGTKYDGDVQDNQLTGRAEITYSNGDKYIGDVDGGVKKGSGTYTWANGGSYNGIWDRDTMNGNGAYLYPSGSGAYMIQGTFANGKPNGECQYYVDASTKYKTDWINGKCKKIYE